MLKNILVGAVAVTAAYVVVSKFAGSKKIEAAKTGTAPAAKETVDSVKKEHKPAKPVLKLRKPVAPSMTEKVAFFNILAEQISELQVQTESLIEFERLWSTASDMLGEVELSDEVWKEVVELTSSGSTFLDDLDRTVDNTVVLSADTADTIIARVNSMHGMQKELTARLIAWTAEFMLQNTAS